MRTIRTLAAAAILAAALTACQPAADSGGSGGSGGAPAPYDNGTDATCFSRLSPVDTGILTGPSIKGTVEVKCTVPPEHHHLVLRLQRDVNGGWTDQARREWTDIPPEVPVFKLTTASCVPGSWRVLVAIDGASATGKPFHSEITGLTKEVKPHDCG